jgi:hypothetical protein
VSPRLKTQTYAKPKKTGKQVLLTSLIPLRQTLCPIIEMSLSGLNQLFSHANAYAKLIRDLVTEDLITVGQGRFETRRPKLSAAA